MTCTGFLVLILINVVSFFMIYALDCNVMPSEYWCYNDASAELCELTKYCDTYWSEYEPYSEALKRRGDVLTPDTSTSSNERIVPESWTRPLILHQSDQRPAPNFHNWPFKEFSELPNAEVNSHENRGATAVETTTTISPAPTDRHESVLASLSEKDQATIRQIILAKKMPPKIIPPPLTRAEVLARKLEDELIVPMCGKAQDGAKCRRRLLRQFCQVFDSCHLYEENPRAR